MSEIEDAWIRADERRSQAGGVAIAAAALGAFLWPKEQHFFAWIATALAIVAFIIALLFGLKWYAHHSRCREIEPRMPGADNTTKKNRR
jgi:hypothetical protein